MAELKSTTYTAQELAAGNAGKLIDSAELISGKVQFFQSVWIVPAGTGVDTVLLGYLPSGVTVIPAMSSIWVSGAGGANPINLGVTGDTGAIAEDIDVSAKGSYLLADSSVSSYKVEEKTNLVAELSGAVTAAITITFNMFVVNSN